MRRIVVYDYERPLCKIRSSFGAWGIRLARMPVKMENKYSMENKYFIENKYFMEDEFPWNNVC